MSTYTYILILLAFGGLVYGTGMLIIAIRASAEANAARHAAQNAEMQAEAAQYIADRWRADALTLRQRHGYNTDLGVTPWYPNP